MITHNELTKRSESHSSDRRDRADIEPQRKGSEVRHTMDNTVFGRPMEIRMVEDSLTDAGLAADALNFGKVKHRLTIVCDGTEAMEFLHREGRFARAPRPDLILLDLTLPKLDGRSVLAKVKADDDLSEIPVVIMTASTAEKDRLRAENLRVDGYMVKPLELAKFIKLVKLLKKRWHADVILPAM